MRLRPIGTPDLLSPSLTLAAAGDGCLIGGSCDADLQLPGETDVGRVQAVIRRESEGCSLETLSAKGSVRINGRPVGWRQTAPLLPGDRLEIGPHVWTLEDDEDMAAAPLAAVAGADADTGIEPAIPAAAISMSPATAAPAETPTADIFDGLLGGPGVVPVGAPVPPLPEGADAHILSDTRPTVLNHEEPELLKRHDEISAVLGGDQRRF